MEIVSYDWKLHLLVTIVNYPRLFKSIGSDWLIEYTKIQRGIIVSSF